MFVCTHLRAPCLDAAAADCPATFLFGETLTLRLGDTAFFFCVAAPWAAIAVDAAAAAFLAGMADLACCALGLTLWV